MPKKQDQIRIDAVRQFNRFYTRQIGALRNGYLHSAFSLPEVRILYELAHRDSPIATEIARELGLDAASLSRTLSRFEKKGLVERLRAEQDRRQRLLQLTREGEKSFSRLDKRARDQVADILKGLDEEDQRRLLKAMRTVQSILDKGNQSAPSEPFVLRAPEPGDLGWVVHRHGVLYAQEYGWDERFEALVAQIVSEFVNNYQAARERCWIAEVDGEIAGSVFCVKSSEDIAKLRLLLVEPRARGMGLGTRLVDECIRFARRVGYKKLVLWTNSVLVQARRIYEKAGFTLVAAEEHQSFGHSLVGENWELTLQDSRVPDQAGIVQRRDNHH